MQERHELRQAGALTIDVMRMKFVLTLNGSNFNIVISKVVKRYLRHKL
jgi:hypothetical protein